MTKNPEQLAHPFHCIIFSQKQLTKGESTITPQTSRWSERQRKQTFLNYKRAYKSKGAVWQD